MERRILFYSTISQSRTEDVTIYHQRYLNSLLSILDLRSFLDPRCSWQRTLTYAVSMQNAMQLHRADCRAYCPSCCSCPQLIETGRSYRYLRCDAPHCIATLHSIGGAGMHDPSSHALFNTCVLQPESTKPSKFPFHISRDPSLLVSIHVASSAFLLRDQNGARRRYTREQ